MESLYITLRKSLLNPHFADLFNQTVNRLKKVWFHFGNIRQTACLVLNPVMVVRYAALFRCTAGVQALDLMTASTMRFKPLVED